MSEEAVPYQAESQEAPQGETGGQGEVKQDEVKAPELDAAQLLKKVENLAKENKNLIRSQQAMANQFTTMVNATVKQKLAELNAVRDEAIDLGDRQKVKDIDQQIRNVEAQAQTTQVTPQVDPSITEFVETHKDWFNKDAEMTDFAISCNEAYLKRHPGDLEASLAYTLDKVKKAFPEKFQQEEKKAPPSPVESGKGQQTTGKYSISRLTSEQKLAYDQYVKRHKLMSHDDYFKSLEEAGYLA